MACTFSDPAVRWIQQPNSPSVITAMALASITCSGRPPGGTTIGANADFVGTVFRGTADGFSITLGDSALFEGEGGAGLVVRP